MLSLLRFFVVTCFGILVSLVATQPTFSQPSSNTTPPSKTSSLADINLASYFTGDFKKAADTFRAKDYMAAKIQFTSALKHTDYSTSSNQAPRAYVELMIALCDTKLNAYIEASNALSLWIQTWNTYPYNLLFDFVHYKAAEQFFLANQLAQAEQHIASVSKQSYYYNAAFLLKGSILVKNQDLDAIIKHYSAYKKLYSKKNTEPLFILAQAHHNKGNVEQAKKLYLTLLWQYPLSSWRRQAQKHLARLYDNKLTLPFVPKASDYIDRGLIYFKAMQNKAAIADLKSALAFSSIDANQRCIITYHLAYSWWKLRKRDRSSVLFDKAFDRCKNNLILKVKAAYQAGRSYFILRQYEEAIKRFERIVDQPTTYADDAKIFQSELYERLNNPTKVDQILESIPVQFPHGDMASEALWRLGWRAYKRKDYQTAVRFFHHKKIRNTAQVLYWLGRTYDKMNKPFQAVETYRACVKKHPLNYYAMVALQRMKEKHYASWQILVYEIQTEINKPPDFNLTYDQRYQTTAFKRGVEFLRLGLNQESVHEFVRAKMYLPVDRKKIKTQTKTSIDQTWTMAFIFDKAGQYDRSHWAVRWNVGDYKTHWPVGGHQTKWRISYPQAFKDQLKQVEDTYGYPMALPTSIMREESAFNSTQKSWASAFGLMQLILPTAKRFAKHSDKPVTAESLYDPDVNIAVSAGFISYLWKIFHGHVGFIVASYNAGEHRILRWMVERGDQEFDEWLEDVPIDQTRNYTKRVLSSYFAYSYLYQQIIPEFPMIIASDWVPQRIRARYK